MLAASSEPDQEIDRPLLDNYRNNKHIMHIMTWYTHTHMYIDSTKSDWIFLSHPLLHAVRHCVSKSTQWQSIINTQIYWFRYSALGTPWMLPYIMSKKECTWSSCYGVRTYAMNLVSQKAQVPQFKICYYNKSLVQHWPQILQDLPPA